MKGIDKIYTFFLALYAAYPIMHTIVVRSAAKSTKTNTAQRALASSKSEVGRKKGKTPPWPTTV